MSESIASLAIMVTFEEIPSHLRLSYFVGEIVIRDSYAEHEARMLWNVLRKHEIVSTEYPRAFGGLLTQTRRALRHDRLSEEIRRVAFGVIESAAKWHRYRSDLVHDLLTTGWRQEGDDVHSVLNRNPPRPLRELERCADELRLVSYRFRGLWVVMPFWLGAPAEGWESAEDFRSWTRVAMGHIADDPLVMRGTPGPSPEPQGGWDAIVAAAVAAEELRVARRTALFSVDEGTH